MGDQKNQLGNAWGFELFVCSLLSIAGFSALKIYAYRCRFRRVRTERVQRVLGDRILVLDRPCRNQMDPPASVEEVERWYTEALGRPCSEVFRVRKLWLDWIRRGVRPMFVYRLPKETVYMETGLELLGESQTPFEVCHPGAQFLMYNNSPGHGCSYLHVPSPSGAWGRSFSRDRMVAHLFEQVELIPENRDCVRLWPERASHRSPTGTNRDQSYAVLIDAAMSLRPMANTKNSFWFWTWDLSDAIEEAELFHEQYGLAVCVARLVSNL